ncbi:hypothetical protein BJ912DRAFT_696395 [Pholiota molesta]|nr:hypothetical protein BJ912DRAFT_696395 [Pholiota molesta]
MAMTLPLSPASDAHPASPTGGAAANANTTAASGTTTTPGNGNNNADSAAPASPTSPASPTAPANTTTSASAAAAAQMKRKPSRRANTAERRATHNAVERQRRETLNGRFLDLAALLPNLSQIRRPSKSSIVNSSIAHIHASRRHRLLAARELRALKGEADALRREINEWRDRAGVPRVDEPVRGEGFGMIISGEMEVLAVLGGEEDEEDEDGMPVDSAAGLERERAMYGAGFMEELEDEYAPQAPVQLGYAHVQSQMQHHAHQQQQQQQQMQHQHHQHQQQQQQHHQQQQQQQQMHHHHQHHQQAAPHHAQQMHTHIPHHLDDMDDPRVAALLLKNAAANASANGPFAHGLPPTPGRSASYDGYAAGGMYVHGYHPQQQQQHHGGGGHLFTPPATAHGLPAANNNPPPRAATPPCSLRRPTGLRMVRGT